MISSWISSKPKYSIIVKNVAKDASLQKIEQFFSNFGDVDIENNRISSDGILTVNFNRPAHIYSVIQAIDNKRYTWTDLQLPAIARLSPDSKKLLLDSQGILIENLPEFSTKIGMKKTVSKLTELCSEYGIVMCCSDVYHNENSLRRMKYEAYVIFTNEESVELAVRNLNDKRHTGGWKSGFVDKENIKAKHIISR